VVRRLLRPAGGALLATALLCSALAACGGTSADQFAPTTHAPTKPIGPPYEITTRHIHGLGSVVVTGHEYTLYLFVPDARSSRSTCDGVCALQWPPLVLPAGVTAPIAGPGIKQSLLGVTTRVDGQRQVVYNGWPLYLWTPDTAPGMATGQGINNLGGLWYVVNPQGNAVR
jgi:predicted lipoprotein with Yx(FWY)xxD motif